MARRTLNARRVEEIVRSMRNKPHSLHKPLRLGFVPLADCAPVVMAHELDLFAKYGVEVELHREVGWATIRDKIIYGELDAAHAPAGLVVAASCGLGSILAECLTGLVMNLHGNAITLSQQLWQRGVRDGATLRREITPGDRLLTFGVVNPYSSHSLLLRKWLRSHTIDPERDVHIVVVPPPQMPANLRAGHLDGYCAGEPWNSVAVLSKIGWCVATSAEMAAGHPEKVLMVRREFAGRAEHAHHAMIAALIEACRFCDRPENRDRVIETLAQPEYVNAPVQALRMSLGGTFDYGNGRVEKMQDFHVFARGNANEPCADKARWVIENLHASGLLADPGTVPVERSGEWFRSDIYRQALQLISPTHS